MASSSPAKRVTRSAPSKPDSTSPATCEECWVLVGCRRGRIWHARRLGRSVGEPTWVTFDGLAILAREERRRDVIGFLHTHPTFLARPSRRDVNTMRAWVSAFGKPLLCAIAGTDGLAGYCFDDDRSSGRPLLAIEIFPRGVLIGVEGDAR